MAGPRRGRQPRRVKKNVPSGVVHIQATFNNTIVTITDPAGNTVSWSSAGAKGFKGSRKSTPYAAQIVAEDAARKAMDHGMKSVAVHIKGPGSGRESAQFLRLALKRPHTLVLKVRIFCGMLFQFSCRRRGPESDHPSKAFFHREAHSTAKSLPELMASSARCSPCFFDVPRTKLLAVGQAACISPL